MAAHQGTLKREGDAVQLCDEATRVILRRWRDLMFVLLELKSDSLITPAVLPKRNK